MLKGAFDEDDDAVSSSVKSDEDSWQTETSVETRGETKDIHSRRGAMERRWRVRERRERE